MPYPDRHAYPDRFYPVVDSISWVARLTRLGVGTIQLRAKNLGDADALDEIADRVGRHPAAAQPRERRHARIIPPAHVAAAHEFGEHALGEDRVAEIEPRKLILARP